ncbi:hypothetical protein JT358_14795 [Micrococcales bacterium 31B]|nr:hypothetical protein [Micrococcales bacterium 31B]
MTSPEASRWRKIKNPEEMTQQILDGYTYAEIARMHQQKFGITLSRAAIEYFARANGLKRRRPAEHYEAIPWYIKSQHSSTQTGQRLMTWSKLIAGEELPPLVVQDFHAWNIARLQAGSVIHYDPRVEGGFIFVKARPGKDRGMFRDPDD